MLCVGCPTNVHVGSKKYYVLYQFMACSVQCIIRRSKFNIYFRKYKFPKYLQCLRSSSHFIPMCAQRVKCTSYTSICASGIVQIPFKFTLAHGQLLPPQIYNQNFLKLLKTCYAYSSRTLHTSILIIMR